MHLYHSILHSFMNMLPINGLPIDAEPPVSILDSKGKARAMLAELAGKVPQIDHLH